MAKTELTYRGPAWVLALAVAAIVAVVVAGAVVVTGAVGKHNDPTVTLVPAAAPGPDPFTASAANGPAVPIQGTAQTNSASLRKNLPSDRHSHLLVATGTAPGLYGGSGNTHLCDPAALVAYLATHPGKAAAWARVLGVAPRGIGAYIGTLIPAVLTSDTLVGNHGYLNGSATSYPSVLEAGTAVMVDLTGTPRVKCNCGNPLTPPTPIELSNAHLIGTAWPGYTPGTVVLVRPGRRTAKLSLADLGPGTEPAPAPAPTGSDATLPDGAYRLSLPSAAASCGPPNTSLDGQTLVVHGSDASVVDDGVTLTGTVKRENGIFDILLTQQRDPNAVVKVVIVGTRGADPGTISAVSHTFGVYPGTEKEYDCAFKFTGKLATGLGSSFGLLASVPLTGSWVGPVDQPGSKPYSTRLDLTSPDALSGAVDYPELSCGGEVSEVSRTSDSVRLTETITRGTGCVPVVTLTITPLDPNELSVAYSWPGGAATATLERLVGGQPTSASASPGPTVLDLPAGLRCADLQSRGFTYRDAVAYWRAHHKPALMDVDGNRIPCETVYPASDVTAVWGTHAGTPVCTKAVIGPVVVAAEGADNRPLVERITCDGPWAVAGVEIGNPGHEIPIHFFLHWSGGAWHRAPASVCAQPPHVPADIYQFCLVS
jgi:hypothetical protein